MLDAVELVFCWVFLFVMPSISRSILPANPNVSVLVAIADVALSAWVPLETRLTSAATMASL